MSKTYRPYNPNQSFLLPPSPREWLPEGHLAYFVLDIVGELNLGPIFKYYEAERRGNPPHHPGMMVALLLYAYAVGVPSSRQIEKKTHEDVAFRVVAGGTHPDHTRISEFRRIHGKALQGLFLDVLKLCQKAGMVKLGHVAIDGTKVKANASKHKAMSYERMQKQEAELEAKVKQLLAAADVADAAEDAKYGAGRHGDELPEELRRSKDRLAKIREAKAALEAEAKESRESSKAPKEPRDPDSPSDGSNSELPSHKVKTKADGTPDAKAQRNFTDPDSRIQKTGSGFLQGYNCQAAVDAEHQIIVAQAVTNQPPDVEHLVPLTRQVMENCGAAPKKESADAGYFSEKNISVLQALGVDPYIATGRTKHGEQPPPILGRPPANLTAKQRMARKLLTKKGSAIYRRRKVIVEPVFGQIKGARSLRSFLMRGLTNVRVEWSLFCTTHNLLKLFRFAAA